MKFFKQIAKKANIIKKQREHDEFGQSIAKTFKIRQKIAKNEKIRENVTKKEIFLKDTEKTANLHKDSEIL